MSTHKIGIIGGMTYKSTMYYYNQINYLVNQELGNLRCAELLMYNVDFGIVKRMIDNKEWKEVENYLANIALHLEFFGAEYIVIATDTMHKVAENVQRQLSIPIIHIADCIKEECLKNKIYNVGLMGTTYTMQEDFLKERLEKSGITIHIPTSIDEMKEMDQIIFEELCNGKILESSKQYYLEIINKMIETNNIEGIILGCTELSMLIEPKDINVPLFDTTKAHINKIVDCYLGKTNIKKLTKY